MAELVSEDESRLGTPAFPCCDYPVLRRCQTQERGAQRRGFDCDPKGFRHRLQVEFALCLGSDPASSSGNPGIDSRWSKSRRHRDLNPIYVVCHAQIATVNNPTPEIATESRLGRDLRTEISRLMGLRDIRTPTELARAAGVSPGAFLTFWRGETERPRAATLGRIADVLHVSVAQLLGDEPLASTPSRPPEVVRVTVTVDGEDYDVYQAAAALARSEVVDLIEGEIAGGARRRESDVAVASVVEAIREARLASPEQ